MARVPTKAILAILHLVFVVPRLLFHLFLQASIQTRRSGVAPAPYAGAGVASVARRAGPLPGGRGPLPGASVVGAG